MQVKARQKATELPIHRLKKRMLSIAAMRYSQFACPYRSFKLSLGPYESRKQIRRMLLPFMVTLRAFPIHQPVRCSLLAHTPEYSSPKDRAPQQGDPVLWRSSDNESEWRLFGEYTLLDGDCLLGRLSPPDQCKSAASDLENPSLQICSFQADSGRKSPEGGKPSTCILSHSFRSSRRSVRAQYVPPSKAVYLELVCPPS
jgi:hypothetical protein